MIRDAELVTKNVVGRVVEALLMQEAKKATAFLSPRLTVKATRVASDGKIDRRDRRADIRITIGAPNFDERHFIKQAVMAGEPFPFRKVMMKPFPKRKGRKR